MVLTFIVKTQKNLSILATCANHSLSVGAIVDVCKENPRRLLARVSSYGWTCLIRSSDIRPSMGKYVADGISIKRGDSLSCPPPSISHPKGTIDLTIPEQTSVVSRQWMPAKKRFVFFLHVPIFVFFSISVNCMLTQGA